MPHARNVVITGASGFVGRILHEGLAQRGCRIDDFDRWKGPLVDALRYRYFGKGHDPLSRGVAQLARNTMRRTEQLCVKAGRIRPSEDDINADRARLAERLRGADAVLHLAALAHPKVPGMTEADYHRINVEGSINLFEAAKMAGVPRFVFASSGQVYGINNPIHIDQFPITEACPTPTREMGAHHYACFKLEVEQYLAAHASPDHTQAVSLRLEFPGVRSRFKWNQYISTSVENTVAGFVCAMEADLPRGGEVFNLVDAEVDPKIVDIQAFLKKRWPNIPNRSRGNACLMSTEKAQTMLGYRPQTGGTYYDMSVMW